MPSLKDYRHYNRYEKNSKAFTVVMAIIFMALVALFVLTMMGMFDEPLWKPDLTIPMQNAQVSWSQSFYGGAM